MSRTSRINLLRNAEHDLGTLSLKFRGCRASDERDKIYALRAMSTDHRDTVQLSPDYDLPLLVVISKLVSYLFESKRIAVSTVLDLLASFVSLTTVCLVLHLERYPTETNAKQNIEDTKLQELLAHDFSKIKLKKWTSCFRFEKRSNSLDEAETNICYSQISRLSIRYTHAPEAGQH